MALSTPTDAAMKPRSVVLYDTTLRDGAQTQGVDFSVADKRAIAAELDSLGVDYIEGGWPGANPTDDAFFARPPRLRHATLTAFGMTCRPGRSASNDPNLTAVLQAATSSVCLVGKASSRAVTSALGITPGENLELIGETIGQAVKGRREVLFDAEHFFDGYAHDPGYALACLQRAQRAGAGWLVLCDTNGGTLPGRIATIVAAVQAALPGCALGIHTHNDTETAVASSLAAVEAGARMIQGTLNGLGERCGNANLVSLIPTLVLKLGYVTGISEDGLQRLTRLSRNLDDRLTRTPNRQAAYVGESAFAHKAGLHAAAMARDTTSYEHIAPHLVGNHRRVVISNQAGRANLLVRLSEAGLHVAETDPLIATLAETLKRREYEGYAYDGAEASFELLARRTFGELPTFFEVSSFRLVQEQRRNDPGHPACCCEASVKLMIGSRMESGTAEGEDAVSALNTALRDVLLPAFPELAGMRLGDCHLRTKMLMDDAPPVTRAGITSHDVDHPELGSWCTIGASRDALCAITASLTDAIIYRLSSHRKRLLIHQNQIVESCCAG